MPKQKKMWDNILTVIMSVLCLLWIYPIVLILLNSLKKEGTFTTSTVFQLPTKETFAGIGNYVYGVTKMGFLSSLGYSLLITITSVFLICSLRQGEHDHLEGHDHGEHDQQVHELAQLVVHAGEVPAGHGAAQQDQEHTGNGDRRLQPHPDLL